MGNKKNYQENALVKNFLTKYTEVNGADKAGELADKTVGNNGYTIGQSFTLVGTIDFKEQTINGNKTVYWVLPTKEGIELSLMSLMGVSSLKGYVGEAVEVEAYTTQNVKVGNITKAEDVKQTRIITPEYIPTDNNFAEVWQPATRNLLTLAGMIAEGDIDLKDKVVTYLGTAVKPIVAKKDGEQNGEKYRTGYKRAIETRLWAIA